MNPFGVGKTGLDRRGAAIAVRQDMETKWKKVIFSIILYIVNDPLTKTMLSKILLHL
jgi:hypothetical protein